MPSKSAKHRKALREIAISNLKKDRNFFVVGLTYGWRRSWKRICGISALSKMAARNCIFVKCFLGKTQKSTPLQLNFECSGAFWLNLVTLGSQ